MTIAKIVGEYLHYYGLLLTDEARRGFLQFLEHKKPELWPHFQKALAKKK